MTPCVVLSPVTFWDRLGAGGRVPTGPEHAVPPCLGKQCLTPVARPAALRARVPHGPAQDRGCSVAGINACRDSRVLPVQQRLRSSRLHLPSTTAVSLFGSQPRTHTVCRPANHVVESNFAEWVSHCPIEWASRGSTAQLSGPVLAVAFPVATGSLEGDPTSQTGTIAGTLWLVRRATQPRTLPRCRRVRPRYVSGLRLVASRSRSPA